MTNIINTIGPEETCPIQCGFIISTKGPEQKFILFNNLIFFHFPNEMVVMFKIDGLVKYGYISYLSIAILLFISPFLLLMFLYIRSDLIIVIKPLKWSRW